MDSRMLPLRKTGFEPGEGVICVFTGQGFAINGSNSVQESLRKMERLKESANVDLKNARWGARPSDISCRPPRTECPARGGFTGGLRYRWAQDTI
jgi:hypothetical protein